MSNLDSWGGLGSFMRILGWTARCSFSVHGVYDDTLGRLRGGGVAFEGATNPP